MRKRRYPLPLPLFAVSFLCIAVSQAFFGVLIWLSFANHFTATALGPFQVISRSLAKDVTDNLDMGKTLTRFQTFPNLAENAIHDETYVTAAVLIKQDGSIAQWYSPKGVLPDDLPNFEKLPQILSSAPSAKMDTARHAHLLTALSGSSFFAESGFEQGMENVTGYLDLVVSRDLYDPVLTGILENFVVSMLVDSSGIFLFVCLLLTFLPIRDREALFKRRFITFLILMPLVTGQAVVSFLFFESTHRVSTEQISRVVNTHTDMLTTRLDRMLALGISLHDISDLDAVLKELADNAPPLKAIAVFDANREMLACGGSQCDQAKYEHSYELSGPDGDVLGAVSATPDMQPLIEELRATIIDALTIMIVSLLLMSEMVLLGLSFFSHRAQTPNAMHLGILRGISFFYFLAADFSISFIPLCMKEILSSQAGEPSAILLGLPVSAEMAAAGLAILVAGFQAGKLPPSRLLLTGILLAAFGNLLSGLVFNPAGYLIARSLAGFGYGLSIISLQNKVVAASEPGMQGTNIAVLFAGGYAGNVCGSSLGAMLADRVGFGPVFLLGTVTLGILACGIVLVFRRKGAGPESAEPSGVVSPYLSARSVTHFLTDRGVGGILLLLVLPASLISVGMLNFLIPINLNDAGIKQSDIGRVFTIYSLVFIFLAPLLSGKIAQMRSKIAPLVFAGCLGGASLFFFALPDGSIPALWCAFGAVICSSIALAIGMSSQISFMLGRAVTANTGDAQAMSLYNTVERIGQVGGPLVFGSAVTLLGSACFSLGAGFSAIACAGLFCYLVWNSSK